MIHHLQPLLDRLIHELDEPDVVGFALLGSHARGDATLYSDVDVVRVVDRSLRDDDRYTLRYVDDHLVSLSGVTLTDKRREFTKPETAIWAVPGWRQARILLDKSGGLAVLQREAMAFQWEPLQQTADEYASYTLMGTAEEAHKVLGALLRNDESAMLYGTWGLVKELTTAVAVQRGVLLETENTYFRQVQESVEEETDWTRAHRIAAGFDVGPAPLRPTQAKAVAGLQLYCETATLFAPIITPQHVIVVTRTVSAIRASRFC